jgi:predicted metal-dependent peptidase
MAVSRPEGRIHLRYNPRFVLGLKKEELDGVVHHEINHVVLGHLDADPNEFPHRRARLIAEEVTANEFVPEPLPGEPLLLDQFPFLPPHEDTQQRYERLVMELPPDDQQGQGVATLDDHSQWPNSPAADPMMALLHSLRYGIRAEDLQLHGGKQALIPWRRVIRRHVRTRLERKAVYHRPPRRFPELLGVSPGIMLRQQRPHVLAAVDTSRSMDAPTLAQINAELEAIHRDHNLTVTECDQRIHATYAYRQPIQSVRGRGNTDFRPVFEASFLGRINSELVIYFTDGKGRVPSRAPAIPVIWCLTAAGQKPTKWGHVYRMEAKKRGDG